MTWGGMGTAIDGYVHEWHRSRLALGASVVDVIENGWEKKVGSWGVFALHRPNGYSAGDQRPGSPALDRGPYGSDAAKHNAQVRSYFVASGLVASQIGSVRRWPPGWPRSRGRVPPPQPAELADHYYTHLGRALDRIPVVDSFAWARMNEDGVVVCEGVYWPPLPRKVADEAVTLAARLADGNTLCAFREKLPAGPGRVTVRHSSFAPESASQPFEAYAVYDIKTSTASGPGAVRHFDADGAEVRLPQERSYFPILRQRTTSLG